MDAIAFITNSTEKYSQMGIFLLFYQISQGDGDFYFLAAGFYLR